MTKPSNPTPGEPDIVDDHARVTVRSNTPENSETFRLARMLVLLDVAHTTGRKIQSLDRLGYYDFFADNPFVVIEGAKRSDVADIRALELAGFSPVQLAYASTGQRFTSRRRRLQYDLARLVGFGLATLTGNGYTITEQGREIADQFRSAYADAFRTSAAIVLRRLSGMSNKGLEKSVEDWLGHSALLLDLLDEVNDAYAPPLSILEPNSNPEGEPEQ